MSRFISLSSTNKILGMFSSGVCVLSTGYAFGFTDGLSRQAAAHGGSQFGQILLVLGNDPFGLSAQDADVLRGKLLRSHHDDGEVRERWPFAQLSQKLEAIHL